MTKAPARKTPAKRAADARQLTAEKKRAAAEMAARNKIAPATRKGPKLLADLMNKPFRDAAAKKAAKLSPVAEGFLDSFADGVTAAKARGEKPTPMGLKAIIAKAQADTKPVAKAPAKKAAARKAPAKKAAAKKAPAKKAAPKVEGAATGAKLRVITMIDEAKAKGISAAEIAKALGWPRAGGTISRAIALAPFKVRKDRIDGTLRYFRA